MWWVKAEAMAAGLHEPYWLFPGRASGVVTEAEEHWHRRLFKQVVNRGQAAGLRPI